MHLGSWFFGVREDCLRKELQMASTVNKARACASVFQESVNRASGRLFDSSEDEESGSEDDSHRFRIKPQFEGRAGQKVSED